MRGAENIIKLRKRGLRPAGAVWVCDYHVKPELTEWKYADDCKNPTVCTADTGIESIDMRFVVGLPVHIAGEDVARVKEIARQCRVAGAQSIVASVAGLVATWKNGDSKWQSF